MPASVHCPETPAVDRHAQVGAGMHADGSGVHIYVPGLPTAPPTVALQYSCPLIQPTQPLVAVIPPVAAEPPILPTPPIASAPPIELAPPIECVPPVFAEPPTLAPPPELALEIELPLHPTRPTSSVIGAILMSTF